jgi:hypothetical protein
MSVQLLAAVMSCGESVVGEQPSTDLGQYSEVWHIYIYILALRLSPIDLGGLLLTSKTVSCSVRHVGCMYVGVKFDSWTRYCDDHLWESTGYPLYPLCASYNQGTRRKVGCTFTTIAVLLKPGGTHRPVSPCHRLGSRV